MKTAAMPPNEVKPPAIQEFLSSFLHQRSVFIPSLAPQGRLHEKEHALACSFWRRRPDLTPLRGTGACLCMPVAGIRLRRTGSCLGVTPHKRKNTPAGCSFLLEAPPGLEPGVRDLQSRALPLGYGAAYEICGRGSVRKSFLERLTRLELATSTLARWRSTG